MTFNNRVLYTVMTFYNRVLYIVITIYNRVLYIVMTFHNRVLYIVMTFHNRVLYTVMTFYNRVIYIHCHVFLQPGFIHCHDFLQQGSFTRLGLYTTLLSSVEEISTSVGRINSSVSQTIWMVELQATGRSNTHCFMAMLASCCIMLKVSLMLRKMAKKYCNTHICYRVM